MKLNKIIATVIIFIFTLNIIASNIVFALEKDMDENKKNEIGLNEDINTIEEKEDINVESEKDDEEIQTEDEKEELKNEEMVEDDRKPEVTYKEKKELENKENNQVEKNDTIKEDNEIKITEKKPKIKYNSHIQYYGWEREFSKADGETSGIEGKSLRLEAIRINLGNTDELLEKTNIKYQVHVQYNGWMSWKQNGEIAGTIGENKRIEAIKIKLENLDGYSVIYKTYVESIGWTEWANNGEISGTEGKGLKIEAIQIKIVENPNISINHEYKEDKNIVKTTVVSSKKINRIIDDNEWNFSDDRLSCFKEYDVNDIYTVKILDIDNIEKEFNFEINQIIEPISKIKYFSYTNKFGWEKKYSKRDGETSGTEDNTRLEAIKIDIGNSQEIPKEAIVNYQVHVQDYGWMTWKQNGEIAGTIGENKRIEAIKINLEGAEGYIVEYRTYIQNLGWQKWKKNNEISGTTGQGNAIEAIQIQIVKENENNIEPTIIYQAHVQNIGWQNEVVENSIAGTVGKSCGIEALKIVIQGVPRNTKLKYQAHVSEIGWQNWKENGEEAGTTGKSKSIEAIKIKLENLKGYSVEYRAYISGYGWQKWKKDGEEAGTTGLSRKIEAIQIRTVYANSTISEPEVTYQTHIQNIGWQNDIKEGFISGTESRGLRIEAIKINLLDVNNNAKIKYRTHVQDIGWQNWRANGTLAGTTGQSKRIEAIQIKLKGLDDYTVEYQVHIQDYGWSDWMIDGETAGTTGKSKRIEAIKIRIVPKRCRQYLGIDVSEFNGNINWREVKNSGIHFAMIRCGYRGYRTGKIVEDAKFRDNIVGASQNGIKVGIYFFSQATSIAEGVEEANYAINLAKKYNITYPIAIDSEMSGAENNDGRADGLNPLVRTNGIVAFCNQVKNNGYIPMVYASRDWLYNNLQVDRILSYETWLAHYTGSSNIKSNYKYDYTMWQYTSSGSVSGINGKVDKNIGYKKY